MENKKKIKCKKCNRTGKTVNFTERSLRDKKCTKCVTKQNKKAKDKRFKQNPAEVLLLDSCRNAYYRGQDNYKTGAYSHVDCEWKSPYFMFETLKNSRSFYSEWCRITEIYLKKKQQHNLRPSLDRIDPSKGYSLDNIRCLPLWENISRGSRGKERYKNNENAQRQNQTFNQSITNENDNFF
jgi:hypothetical protein